LKTGIYNIVGHVRFKMKVGEKISTPMNSHSHYLHYIYVHFD